MVPPLSQKKTMQYLILSKQFISSSSCFLFNSYNVFLSGGGGKWQKFFQQLPYYFQTQALKNFSILNLNAVWDF